MAGPNDPPGGSGKDDLINFDDPLCIPSYNATITIVTIKLTSNENFRLWRSSVTRALKDRNKLGFVDVTFKKDFVDQNKNSNCERANVVVCYWILSSISESIYTIHAYSEVAQDIWEGLFETYNKADSSVMFNIHQQTKSIKQNGMFVSDFFQ